MGCVFCDALVVLPWWEVSLGVGRARVKALCRLGLLPGAMAVVLLSGSGAGASGARAGALKEWSFSSWPWQSLLWLGTDVGPKALELLF